MFPSQNDVDIGCGGTHGSAAAVHSIPFVSVRALILHESERASIRLLGVASDANDLICGVRLTHGRPGCPTFTGTGN